MTGLWRWDTPLSFLWLGCTASKSSCTTIWELKIKTEMIRISVHVQYFQSALPSVLLGSHGHTNTVKYISMSFLLKAMNQSSVHATKAKMCVIIIALNTMLSECLFLATYVSFTVGRSVLWSHWPLHMVSEQQWGPGIPVRPHFNRVTL